MAIRNPFSGLSRNARLFLSSVFATHLGNGLQTITAAFVTLEETRSIAAVGMLFVLISLPQIAVSLLAGRFSNRLPKRWICLGCDGASVVAAGALALCLVGDAPVDRVLAVYAASFALSVIDAVHNPISNALLAEIIPEDETGRVSAVMETALQAGMFLSAAVGGLVVAWTGAAAGFAINGATFAISALLIAAIRHEGMRRPSQSPGAAAETSYSAILRSHARLLPPILLFGASKVVITLSNTLLVVLVIQHHEAGMGVFGVTDALAGIGVILASFAYEGVRRRLDGRSTIALGFLGCAAFTVLQPQGGSLWLMVFLTLEAFSFGIGRIATRAMMLEAATDEMAGRMFALSNAIGLAASMALIAVMPPLIAAASIHAAFYALALFLASVTATALYAMGAAEARDAAALRKAGRLELRIDIGP